MSVKDDIHHPQSRALNYSRDSSVSKSPWAHLLRLELKQVPVGPQCLENVIREPTGASVILTNVVNHIAKLLPSPGPPCLVDHSLLTWINNEHTLHISNKIVSSIVINKNA